MAIKILKKVAEDNTKVTTKKGRDPEKVIEEGKPLDHALKQDPKNIEMDKIGLSKGVTVNLGDFQSVRVDCWLTTSLENGENTQQALDRIGKEIDGRIELEVNKVRDSL